MPVMDGYDACRLINEYFVENQVSHLQPKALIYALTSDCSDETNKRID